MATITPSMAKSTRSSASPSVAASAGKTGKKRGGNPYGVGGTLLTVLLAVLVWWLNGGKPTGNAPAAGADRKQAASSTALATLDPPTADAVTTEGATDAATATATLEAAATDAPTPTIASPTATDVSPPTATARPAPTATKPPKPTPSPTSKVRAGPPGIPTITLNELPPEARDTLALIEDGGPFPFARDGITFQNRERLLPSKPRGYYREYTVITPGESDRGARRIIAGENGELYYTADHYESFYWIVEP